MKLLQKPYGMKLEIPLPIFTKPRLLLENITVVAELHGKLNGKNMLKPGLNNEAFLFTFAANLNNQTMKIIMLLSLMLGFGARAIQAQSITTTKGFVIHMTTDYNAAILNGYDPESNETLLTVVGKTSVSEEMNTYDLKDETGVFYTSTLTHVDLPLESKGKAHGRVNKHAVFKGAWPSNQVQTSGK